MSYYEDFVKICKRNGLTPCGAALKIGISKPTVSRWKNGSNPTDATAFKVADFFGVQWSREAPLGKLEEPTKTRVKVQIRKKRRAAHE